MRPGVRQYLEKRPDNLLDSDAMAAGERAIGALAEFGYMERSLLAGHLGAGPKPVKPS